MRLVFLHEQTVAIANAVAKNSLWKAGRPYLCIPMRKNANVFHIIPFRTSKRKPSMRLLDTVYYPLKRGMAKNESGEYPYLDLSKSFLVRENHFKDVPDGVYIDGYMRAAAGLTQLTGMSRKYIAKMNAGKLEGVRSKFCVDYAAILEELDRQMPLMTLKPSKKRLSKNEKARQQEMMQTYEEVGAELVSQQAARTPEPAIQTAPQPAPVALGVSVQAMQAAERAHTYAEIDKEIQAGNEEQLAYVKAHPAPVEPAAAPFVPAPAAYKVRQPYLYGTTMDDIRAVELEQRIMDNWLDSNRWTVDLMEKERNAVYDEVSKEHQAEHPEIPDLQKAMREEVYLETDVGSDESNDDVDP